MRHEREKAEEDKDWKYRHKCTHAHGQCWSWFTLEKTNNPKKCSDKFKNKRITSLVGFNVKTQSEKKLNNFSQHTKILLCFLPHVLSALSSWRDAEALKAIVAGTMEKFNLFWAVGLALIASSSSSALQFGFCEFAVP